MSEQAELSELVAQLEAAADPARLRTDVARLAASPRNQRWAPSAMAAAQAHVAAELAAAGWLVERQQFTVPWRVGSNDSAGRVARLLRVRPYRGLSGTNLVARHPAAVPGPVVVVGAHLDTVRGSPGADDNASGVAAVLEVARLVGGLGQPPPVVLAVFDLEELGLVGASVAARSLVVPGGTEVSGMIGLESVGFYTNATGSQRLPAGAGRVFPAAARQIADGQGRGDFTLVVHRRTSAGAAEVWRSAAAATSGAHRGVLLLDPRPDGLRGTLGTVRLPHAVHLSRSDHAAFWRRGVPSMMLTDTASFRNPHYHRHSDRPVTLDYARMSAVAVATAATAATWALASG